MKTILEIEPAYESALRAAGLADFDAMMRVEGGPPTSQHRHRETLPIQIDIDGRRERFFLKRVFKVPPKHALWPMIRGRRGASQPHREWHILGELGKAGIPAMRRVAFGERRRCGMPAQAFLLVAAVPMAYTLENWLVPGFPRPAPIEKRLRDRLIYELGVLVRRLHDAGFDWPDISAKHIYAAPRPQDCGTARPPATTGVWHGRPARNPTGETPVPQVSSRDAKISIVSSTDALPVGRRRRWDFCLIDVERMTTRGPRGIPPDRAYATVPMIEEMRRSWQRLVRSLSPMQIDRSDAWRFWAGLCRSTVLRCGGRDDPARRNRDGSVRAPSVIGADTMPRLPDDYEHPRCVPLRKLGKMFADEQMIPWLRAAGLDGFDDVFRYNAGGHMTKAGLAPHRERIRMEVSNGCGQTRAFYLKRYERPPLREQMRRIWECGVKSSTAWREMHFLKKLSALGIPTMRGVAFGQRMKGFLEKRSFGITEEIHGQSLEELAEQASSDPARVPSWSQRREIIRQLALLARHLHRNHLFHRDLYLCHVFLTHRADGGIVLRLIDLARMIEKPAREHRWKLKDLAALDYSAPAPLVTRADRIRFLYHYQADRRQRGSIDRQLLVAAQARTRRMARHDANRARRFEREAKA
ncbi:MAG: hypothetical protein JXQ75_13020 [Phycisphaerae bacterium]|nr:hypothetical protein [Phycisphaerae bacterium]